MFKIIYLAILLYVLTYSGLVSAQMEDKDVHIFNIKAERYHYTPNMIVVKAGRAVELHIQSKDVLHGFSIPRLNIRADLVPNETAIIKLQGLESGVYPFACDIFCGENHSSMSGRIVVK